MHRLIIFLVVLQIWINTSKAATNVLPKNRQRGSGLEGKLNLHSFDSASDRLSNPSYEKIPQGKYVANDNKWAYKPDNRGKYVHVAVPYNGGYGPFENPYGHIDNPYAHLEKKYEDDPFKTNYYNDRKPAIIREYGAPLFNV